MVSIKELPIESKPTKNYKDYTGIAYTNYYSLSQKKTEKKTEN